jgi:hypothetical protein
MAICVMTYDLAMAIFKDTANRSMRQAGRTSWNEEDYNAGVEAFHRCLPPEWRQELEA